MLSNWQADDEEEDADGPVGTKLLQIPEWLMVKSTAIVQRAACSASIVHLRMRCHTVLQHVVLCSNMLMPHVDTTCWRDVVPRAARRSYGCACRWPSRARRRADECGHGHARRHPRTTCRQTAIGHGRAYGRFRPRRAVSSAVPSDSGETLIGSGSPARPFPLLGPLWMDPRLPPSLMRREHPSALPHPRRDSLLQLRRSTPKCAAASMRLRQARAMHR